MCDQRGFDKWLEATQAVDAAKWRGFGCATFNPGVDYDFLVDFNGRRSCAGWQDLHQGSPDQGNAGLPGSEAHLRHTASMSPSPRRFWGKCTPKHRST